ncbi:hypothetical protein ACQKQC_19080 [Vibrio fortis]|uniref:hypothetical protein n=1 Tax=Vibrio fortis TaxID=212667 RepID=UPI004068EE58
MVDADVLPEWANEILIAKGIGFERAEVKSIVWTYYVEQLWSEQDSQSKQESTFGQMLTQIIKDGGIEKAKAHFATLDEAPPVGTVRQSKLAEFEEKMARYLEDD